MQIDEKMKLNKNQQVNKSTYLVKSLAKALQLKIQINVVFTIKVTSRSQY